MGTRTPREHVEEIRRVKFSIGGEANPLREDLHQAVKNLSAELYAKDVHFLMELIQNAEDNEYQPEVKPSLEFIITSKDITETGATSTLLIFNNEKGFFERNIESICSVGRSTKKGNRQRGYIGEKGIGFKSIFLITSQPYIFSNGYQIRFNEQPLPDCDIGYIVPEWVEKNPTLSDIHQIYGFDKTLPTTTIVLPLKLDKVGAVKQQLSSIHPEVLLFLSKIKQLSVREHNNDPSLNTINAISISCETDFTTRKNIDAESFTLHLCADESDEGQEKECAYHMWRQKFPVRLENRVERRMEVEEWVITLAFPFGQRLDRGMTSPGIYAFLPTEMVTNFPFIIQADFILASSRENILMDNKWNIGILDCVPSAFTSAFVSLVKATESAPASSLPPIFQFLPLKSSSYLSLNHVRDAIKKEVVAEYIIPCESYIQQKIFCKPDEVGRLMPSFWDILTEARVQGVQLHNLSSHGIYILNSVFDQAKYNDILDYLGVQSVSDEWYVRCIKSSNLVLGISEELYLELLCFLADNWNCHFRNTGIKSISLLKYVDQDGKLALWSINSVTESINSPYICLSSVPGHASWLINWNLEFRYAANRHFIPCSTQEALNVFPKGATIREWLKQQAIMETLTVYSYADLLAKALRGDRKLVIAFTHFLFHSLKRKYLSEWEVAQLCDSMPLVDNYGLVTTHRKRVLVPANNSKWVGLLGSNPWKAENFVELGEDYLRAGQFAGLQTGKKELMQFMATHVKASDIPDLCPPDANFHTVSSPLTKENTFMLLEWIRSLKYKGVQMPARFLQCIKNGSWLKTSVGYKPPSESFLSSLEWGNLLQVGSIMVDIPLIDRVFYDNKIHLYNEELKTIGVMFDYGEACNYIGNRLMTLSSSYGLTKGNVLSMLNFIRFLREKLLSPQDFIKSIKEGTWLKTTTHGSRSPVGSILFDSEWKFASEISNLPFIDKEYYGEEILSYRTELQLLGVVVGFNQNYQLVADHFRLPSSFSLMAADSVLLMLRCIQHSRSSQQLISKLQDKKWVKTNSGYRLPSESFLFNNEWGCILEIFNGFPLIDESFYGSNIRLYTDELKELGVVVGLQDASKAITHHFKEASKSISRDNVFALLDCYRYFKRTKLDFPRDLFKCIRDEEWLRTRLGYKSPKDSILFDAEWEPISLIASLPFIDGVGGYYGNRICEYRDELKQFGAVVEFKEGYKFVATCLKIRSPNDVTPTAALSLLKCVRNMLEKSIILPEGFMSRINQKWLKTVMGFRSPCECILFDSKWGSFLQRDDGPFIDEAFYGAEISSYQKELKAIGVILEVENGCSLLAAHIKCHSHFDAISRIYRYLYEFNWTPVKMDGQGIWIPHGNDNGEWVNSDSCVFHDKDNLFSSQLNVLDKHYDKKFLSFFSMAFGVRASPNIHDYCKLWNHWENLHSQLTRDECCAFWFNVAKHWNSKTEKLVSGCLKKLPVNMGSGGIVLVNKEDVFIPDDLQLKDLFDKASEESMFAWYPQPSLPPLSQSKIYEIFDSIGVRTISESVQKSEPSKSNGFDVKKVEPKDALIRNGLFKILLAFLADPSLEMPAEKRHLSAKQLHDVVVYESDEPITVDYSLHLSSGKILSVKASRMIRWDRDNSKLLTQKVDRSSGYKTMIEFSTYFCEVISEGLLWDKPDRVGELSELIKLGCLLEFDEDAIDFLLKTKNLQLFVEDEEFLISTLSSD